MPWSLKLAKFGETTVYIHATFFLLLAWAAAASWPAGGLAAAASAVILVCLVFVCVVLHEFGHILTARRFGIKTPDITLLPIGGVARLERMPEKPAQELLVALAGPAVNVVIAFLLLIVLGAQFDLSEVSEFNAAQMTLLGQLAAINIMLVVFNLIPAFPLDGGRVLRALVSMGTERARATLISARIGQGFALLFAVLGFFGNPFLILIAIFMFFAAEAESGYETRRSMARGLAARDAAVTRYESLGPDSTAEDAANLLLETTQQEFPVLAPGGRLLGFVTSRALVQAMREGGPSTPVKEFMSTEVPETRDGAPLEKVMETLERAPDRIVAVTGARGEFVGYISAQNASELFMLRDARRQSGEGGSGDRPATRDGGARVSTAS